MKLTTQQFLTGFNALNGITIGERRKNLFQLLNYTHQNDYSEIDFRALQPKTNLEEVFKVDILMHFQKIQDLLAILQCENPILIGKVFKAKAWFWNDAFENITAQQFVYDILGRVSFITKVKMLNKLAIYLSNPQKAIDYYNEVKSKYGLYLAVKLLPCCSKEFILSCIEDDHIKLTESQLLLLVKKYPDIIEDILSALKTIGVFIASEYEAVFKFIASNNIELYLKLREVYNIKLRLGWRITQKFVHANKQDVINNASDYYQIFHTRQMVRTLQQEFIVFYSRIFPKSLDDLSSRDIDTLLQVVKYLRHPDYNIMLHTFKNVYGCELWESPELVSLDLLKMLPTVEREAKLQREYKPHNVSDNNWMCYYGTNTSVSYLKNRISITSDIYDRAELIGLLVETCKINEDKVALAQICRHMVNRHRNDNIAVRVAFMEKLSNTFKLDNLDETHWVPVNELIQIFTLNNETFYAARDFMEAYILYRIKQNLPIKEQLTEFCSLKFNKWNLFQNNPKFEKLCLLAFADIIQNTDKDEDLMINNVSFISAVISFNKRNKHDQISIFSFPKALESVNSILKKEKIAHNATNVISYCMRQKEHLKECNQLVNLFLQISEHVELDILMYLIQKKPEIVHKYITNITNLVMGNYSSRNFKLYWRYCRNYEHLEIPQHIIKVCLDYVKGKQEECGRNYKTKIAIHALSYLMPPHEYLQIVKLHYPPELKADAATPEGQKTYELQEYIGNSLKNLIPPSLALESILNFCKGDYLKLIQSSLYSVSYATNEDKLQPFFAELMGRAVSIRKHALHLTFQVLDKPEICSVLDTFMKTETNPSIRKFIFKHSFNFFIKNKDDYSWNLVKLNISAVDVNDQEAFEILMQHTKIPKAYLAQYLTFTWAFLEQLPDPEDKIECKKTSLLDSINANIIYTLGKDFSEPIIKKYFFKFTKQSSNRFQVAIQTFACKYVIYSEPSYLETLFATLKEYISSTWQNKETEGLGRLSIQEFIERLCNEFLGNDDSFPHVLVFYKFGHLWNAFLKPHEAFIDYLQVALTTLYLKNLGVDETVVQLATLCNYLIELYGAGVMGLITAKMDEFIHYFAGSYEQEDIYKFIEKFVENNSSLPCMQLAVSLIDSNKPSKKTKERYEKIVNILRTKNEPVIQILLHVHFTKCTNL